MPQHEVRATPEVSTELGLRSLGSPQSSCQEQLKLSLGPLLDISHLVPRSLRCLVPYVDIQLLVLAA